MLGLPNDLLATVARDVAAAEHNVSHYVSDYGVDIRFVAVGNEPFLKSYKGQFEAATLPAVRNVQAALVKAGLARQVRVTVPLNADVYESLDGRPSSGDFRPDITTLTTTCRRRSPKYLSSATGASSTTTARPSTRSASPAARASCRPRA
ncbi:hypothetical protein VPH35_087563 [Triticum aestivum]